MGKRDGIAIRLPSAVRWSLGKALPDFADRLMANDRGARTIRFDERTWSEVALRAGIAAPHALGRESGDLIAALTAIRNASPSPGDYVPACVPIFQFRVELLGTDPPIWRRIQTPDQPLAYLADDLLSAMGWEGTHLWEFRLDKKRYCDLDEHDIGVDEERIGGYGDAWRRTLSDFFSPRSRGKKFEFLYDYGDNWLHEVRYERRVVADPQTRYPICVEGEYACPPDDCGGVWGYRKMLDKLARDPLGAEKSDDWIYIDRDFDPADFDPALATAIMRGEVLDDEPAANSGEAPSDEESS